MSGVLELVLSLTAILFSGVTAGFSILAYAKVIGLEKSTHKIEYISAPMPNVEAGETPNPTGKDLLKKFEPMVDW